MHKVVLLTFLFSCQNDLAIGLIFFDAISNDSIRGKGISNSFAAYVKTSILLAGLSSAILIILGVTPSENKFIRCIIDPAISSSVFVTTITDVIGFLSFLGIGSYFFLN